MPRSRVIKFLALFYLVLMSVQYLPIEGYGVSYIKFGAMCFAPLLWLIYSPKLSKAMLWGGLYLIAVVSSALYNFESFRLSTIGYMCSFVAMFILYYNLIYLEQALTLDDFIKFIRRLILAYAIVLIAQQGVRLIGVNSFPIINLMYGDSRGFLIGNSLAIEQSHTARILTVLFLCLMRMYDVKWSVNTINIKKFYQENRWTCRGFVWSMVTMGSGTAFVGLGILALYFAKRKYIAFAVPLLLIFYFLIPIVNYEPINRAKSTMEAAMTLDRETVIQADHSAAARIVPLINTINNLDLTNADTWLGNGIDTGLNMVYLGEDKRIGGINDYGLVVYILSLILLFSCVIYKIVSIETIIFLMLLSATISNVAYVWGILILLTTLRYFTINIHYNE